MKNKASALIIVSLMLIVGGQSVSSINASSNNAHVMGKLIDSRTSDTQVEVMENVEESAWEAWDQAIANYGWDGLIAYPEDGVRVDFVESSPFMLTPTDHSVIVTKDGTNYRFALSTFADYDS